MPYRKGLEADGGAAGDDRAQFGFGRPAHGSSGQASYQFAAPRNAVPIDLVVEAMKGVAIPLSDQLSVADLQYEHHVGEKEETARIKISAPSNDAHSYVEFQFSLDHQAGDVDATLAQARSALIVFLGNVLAKLRAIPLRLD